MKKITIFTILVLCAGVALFAAQQLTIEYLDGTVELRTAKGWTALSIGDGVAADASIRVSKSGSVELSLGTQRISILKDGTYAVADLMRAAGKSGKAGIGVALTQKFHALTTEKEKVGSVGGTRGEQQGTPAEDVQWVEEGDEARTQASEFFAKGQYAEAIPILNDAVKTASSPIERQELGYLLASAYYGAGKTAQAYRTISKVSLDVGSTYYPDYVILKAEILLDSFLFKDSLAVVNTFIASKPSVAYAQVAYLVAGQCSRGLGDEKAAATALSTGYKLDPESETGQTISAMLNE
jgi:tetratricopeptide (TPR) repeat protein